MKRLLFLLILVFNAYAECAELLEFDVHFAVITANPEAHKAASIEQLKKEIDILNTFFTSEDKKPLVKFKFKSASFYNEIKDLHCSFAELGDSSGDYDSDGWAELFNSCMHFKVRDPNAVNFFIYDSYSKDEGFKDITCHGKRNSNRPYVLIDWERLDHKIQSPEEHEMGHAFGLDHVTVKGAEINSDTNIMASAESGSASGGKRNIGFNSEQVKIILSYAAKIKEKLKL